ncbi:fructose-1,6-bisphosphatase class 1/Sedoheputulose-1,7-bisphosphatase [Thelonectria olida]|uniref:Fructose-1,6-bisphosphatase class 1/Sedoheputulose-1,7-bisphosphatase n=1 Tax=Thelonectria olida TaxID=1576542 RepID=A0A9P8W7N5_9HYPO|nr:fructose-1,6-bisphosphatase class 1/Sedoheputulose-1,7-bisphosphatase [Thelonectria olida]
MTKGTNGLSLELVSLLKSLNLPDSRTSLHTDVLPSLLGSIADIGKALRSANVSLAGSANTFGDDQLNVDVLAEKVLRDAIAKCPAIVAASSEEDPIERPARQGETPSESRRAEQYTVAFDPLDGSSIIAPNWSVGTIIGIWDGPSALSQDPATKQVGSILGVYGPRTTAVVALRIPNVPDVCFEVRLGEDSSARCEVVRPEVRLSLPPFKTRYFAPANLRAAAEDVQYMNLITKFVQEKYTLRYSGGLIPDVVHALVKGHGIYISPVTKASDAKLRRLYELCPVALVVECAGGQAIDPADGKRILDRNVSNCDERAGLVCGTTGEVDVVKDALRR